MPRRRRRIEKWLAGTETPVFVLDTDRVVAWFNTGCESLTGWLAEDVVGWRCDYSSEFEAGTVDALVASICPPPELDRHPEGPVPIQISCRDGRSLPSCCTSFPSPTTRPVRTASWVCYSLCNRPSPLPKHPPTVSMPNWPRCGIPSARGSASTRCWDADQP